MRNFVVVERVQANWAATTWKSGFKIQPRWSCIVSLAVQKDLCYLFQSNRPMILAPSVFTLHLIDPPGTLQKHHFQTAANWSYPHWSYWIACSNRNKIVQVFLNYWLVGTHKWGPVISDCISACASLFPAEKMFTTSIVINVNHASHFLHWFLSCSRPTLSPQFPKRWNWILDTTRAYPCHFASQSTSHIFSRWVDS